MPHLDPTKRRLQLTILTGFLGSGKTTFIERFLHRFGSKNTGVIVNEFGEIGIDDLVLTSGLEGDLHVRLLRDGCICCAAGNDLSRAIRFMHGRLNEQADPAAPLRLIIETSGLADPLPLVQRLILDLNVRPLITFAGVVAIVDATTGGATFNTHPLLSKQVAMSDQIILSKTDIAPPDQSEAVLRLVRRHNTIALVHDGSAPLDPAEILDSRLVRDGLPSPHLDGQLASSPHGGNDCFSSASVQTEQPVTWDRFLSRVDWFLSRYRRNLLRLKGLLHVSGRRGPMLVNGVGVVFHRPVELGGWPGPRRRSALVAITHGRSDGLATDLRSLLD